MKTPRITSVTKIACGVTKRIYCQPGKKKELQLEFSILQNKWTVSTDAPRWERACRLLEEKGWGIGAKGGDIKSESLSLDQTWC